MRVYFDADADLSLIRGRRVAVIGYGNQGRAQALNLRDSGVSVTVALPGDSRRREKAATEGFDVMTSAAAAAQADLVVLLAADEDHGRIYAEEIEPNLREGAALQFAHGLSIRFGLIEPRPDLDVFMVAPKGPGSALRTLYEEGKGMLALWAVAQDASGMTQGLALAYGRAIGCGRAGLMQSSFAEECEADLFNEQAVVWGAVPELLIAGFDTLVASGVSPEVAYMECVGELSLIAQLIERWGIAGMREAISNTAELGATMGGERIIDKGVRARMAEVLAEVRAGKFAKALSNEQADGYPRLNAARARARTLAVEEARLRLLKASR